MVRISRFVMLALLLTALWTLLLRGLVYRGSEGGSTVELFLTAASILYLILLPMVWLKTRVSLLPSTVLGATMAGIWLAFGKLPAPDAISVLLNSAVAALSGGAYLRVRGERARGVHPLDLPLFG